MNLSYLLPRIIRHFLPDWAVRQLLRRRLIIKPGLETVDPEKAVQRYLAALAEYGITPEGKRVLVFGYGGNFTVGCALLEAGANHVVLCDRFAPPDHARNRLLLTRFARYLQVRNDQVLPDPVVLTLLEEDIRETAAGKKLPPVDLILSSSVYEHLDDVSGITRALAALTAPDGVALHFIDQRDHFFRYPFEMLRFSDRAWRNWLNPTSNLNRFRLWDYRQVFEQNYRQLNITILQSDPDAFERAQSAIRPEFISSSQEENCATIVRVTARGPQTHA